ncbi:MAG: phosphoglycerate kinase [Azospirillaceae bacterium]
MTGFKTLDDVDVAGKTVLVRGDLNVPMEGGKVTDLTRLERLAPTIQELCRAGAKVVVMSHFGRPKGRKEPTMSLAPVAEALGDVLGTRVSVAQDCVGPAAEAMVAELGEGGVLVLENLRFHAGEEANDAGFAAKLAALGDIYVNDAFSAAHRAHASTEAIARLLPAVAGRLMEAELKALTAALEKPERPVAAIVGGAKISTKLELLGNLIAKVDRLILGGGMANTFLAARGFDLGRSLVEREMLGQAREIMDRAEAASCAILLPSDAVVAREVAAQAPHETVAISAVPQDAMVLDVGPNAIDQLKETLSGSATLVWNGPLGVFEKPPFDHGTVVVAREAARLTKAGTLLSVAGGGDTVAALAHAGVVDDFSYVSTAGGAFLEWLEGKTLPGVAALTAG